ncbi:MAG: type IX secretion system outer membrane channel protein PorV [Prevotellaceae bacterium]|jgi:hypothetical protein|nr:type IX secretion system outer membrane channel protein PorV [Prevotellaceae bacterium]
MKKITVSLLLMLLASTGAYAQVNDQLNPILTGVPSLTIAPDARAGAMGDAGAATMPDVNSQHWNAAKYVFMESDGGVGLSYTPWLRELVGDINLAYLAGYYKIAPNQAVSASLRYFSLGDVTMTGEGNPPQVLGDAKPNEFAIDVAYSLLLSENISGAVTLRYIRSDLNISSMDNNNTYTPANAIAADIAAYYKTLVPMANGDADLAFGAGLSNIGSKISYDDNNTSTFLPTNFRLGGSFGYPFDEYNKISINADINKLMVIRKPQAEETSKEMQDYYSTSGVGAIFQSFGEFSADDITYSLGAEYSYQDQFFLRAGYFHESEVAGNRRFYTMGAGFKMNVFSIDAGYVIAAAQTSPLDNTLRFSLSFNLDGLRGLMQ